MYGKLAYGNFKNKFLKISAVKKENSSNYFRKKYIISNFKLNKNNKLLDFGSGTGIFPYSINKICDCYFHDKDKNSINFCKNFLNLKFANISKLKSSKPQFDYITCNKVLEHMSIQDIKKNLLIFKKLLKKSGKIYIELPDERASKKGYSRQEFFSEHINIFSIKSSKLFFSKLGFTINKISSLLEVTNKYTLRIILSKN
jgi:2-polyprenyl-3-methyl-5-hydroxy-6-metoxy-1,4-benzoquinol methylase